MGGLERALCPDHLPAVLSRRDVLALLAKPEAPLRRIDEILYSSGLRLLECLSVRVKDVHLERHPIMVCRSTGNPDRAALLPTRAQLHKAERRHRAELEAGRGEGDPRGR